MVTRLVPILQTSAQSVRAQFHLYCGNPSWLIRSRDYPDSCCRIFVIEIIDVGLLFIEHLLVISMFLVVDEGVGDRESSLV